jgi:hypothetical protein
VLIANSAIGLSFAIMLLLSVLLVAWIYGRVDLSAVSLFGLPALLSLLSIPTIIALRKYSKRFVRNAAISVGIWIAIINSFFALSFSIDLGMFWVFYTTLSFLPFVSLALLLLWVASLIAATAVAKGRDWVSFFVLSLLFPIVMWIVVSVISGDPTRVKNGEATKTCPRCAELVKREATLCKHCGSDLPELSASATSQK